MISALTMMALTVSCGQLTDDQQNWIPKNIKDTVFKDREIKRYERTEWFQNGVQGGLLDHVTRNLSSFKTHPTGHANFTFPWKHTAGISDQSTNAKVLTFVSKPKGGKILVWREQLPMYFTNDPMALAWAFPKDTIFMEVILVTDAKGYDHTTEVRTRKKVTDVVGNGIRTHDENSSGWEPKTYIPNINIEKMFPKHVGTENEYPIFGFRINKRLKLKTLSAIDATVFDGVPFVEGKHKYITNEYSLVPKGYFGTVTKCATCHSQTLMHSRHIDPSLDWYGNVRGSDEIFSFPMYPPNDRSQYQVDQRLIDMGWVSRP
jgi:hypothetical protein